MEVVTKITLIKELRAMSSSIVPFVQKNEATNKYEIVFPTMGLGLKEAKDFVEKCMALGTEKVVRPNVVYKLTQVSIMDGRVNIEPKVIGFYGTRDKAVSVMDGIMRLKNYNDVWENEYDFQITEVPVEWNSNY